MNCSIFQEPSVLMDEHTWDSYNSVSSPTSREAVGQLAVKDAYATGAQAQTDFIVRNSMASLSNSISVGVDNVIVFNTLNWKRSGLVALDMDRGSQLIDESDGNVVPVEVIGGDKNYQHVQFMADEVPAVGYRVYKFVPAKEASPAAVTHQNTTMESNYYRVQLDPATGARYSRSHRC